MKDWTNYQTRTYGADVCKLLIEFLDNYKIYNSIEDNGYFVGQLFGDRDAWNVVESINTFPIDKVKEYLKNYKIIKFEEVEYVRESDSKKWHVYDIIAQKKVGE